MVSSATKTHCNLRFEEVDDIGKIIDIFWEHPDLRPRMINTWDGRIIAVPKNSLQILRDNGIDVDSALQE